MIDAILIVPPMRYWDVSDDFLCPSGRMMHDAQARCPRWFAFAALRNARKFAMCA
jgi:hypothetical protein